MNVNPDNAANSIKPLTGITVADFSLVMAGPFASRLLADMGADVIKIEPITGDDMRTRLPLRDGFSTYFGQLNVGKRSIAVNLKTPEGLAVAREIAERADVVLENFRPGVMQRLGLDFETLSKVNPRLVYCAISGFGQTGPASKNPAYAPVVHAASGFDLANMSYQDNATKPGNTAIFMADVLGGTYAFGAIQAALLQRAQDGRGQMVDLSLMDCMLNMMIFECQEAQFPVNSPRHIYTPMKAADGFVIAAPLSQKNFDAMAQVIGNPDWTKDAKFATTALRERHWHPMIHEIEKWTITRPALECEQTFMAAGLPCSRYKTVAEAMDWEQTRHRATMRPVADGAGAFNTTNPPFLMSRNPYDNPRVPSLGEQSRDILAQFMGAAEVDRLLASGGVR
ncbi:MAG: CoA:oxalate CoA-transferase [Paracoccaceae bacterium]|jgi:CoA:oxalate CoA-transferase